MCGGSKIVRLFLPLDPTTRKPPRPIFAMSVQPQQVTMTFPIERTEDALGRALGDVEQGAGTKDETVSSPQ
jgi:hypothetical protein